MVKINYLCRQINVKRMAKTDNNSTHFTKIGSRNDTHFAKIGIGAKVSFPIMVK